MEKADSKYSENDLKIIQENYNTYHQLIQRFFDIRNYLEIVAENINNVDVTEEIEIEIKNAIAEKENIEKILMEIMEMSKDNKKYVESTRSLISETDKFIMEIADYIKLDEE